MTGRLTAIPIKVTQPAPLPGAFQAEGHRSNQQRRGSGGKTHEFYTKSAATAQESAKVLTEVAETAWGSTKMLNEKLAQNLTANVEASFAAAHAIAKAQSLPEALKLHAEFFQKLATQTTEQTKEFFDLSTRATQHVFEQVQAGTAKAMKPVA